MCDAGLAIAGAGLGMQMLGSVQAGNAANQAAQADNQASLYNAQVADNNAVLAERQARDAEERGRVERQRYLMQSSQLRGQERAALAASGLDISSGSPLQAIGDSAALAALDAGTITSNAAREAHGIRVQGVDYTNQATLHRQAGRSALSRGRSAQTAGFLGGGASLLTGASRVARVWGTS
ncbi:MAG: phage protein [Rhodospirillales bacterium]